jgi:hypothetical protein
VRGGQEKDEEMIQEHTERGREGEGEGEKKLKPYS